MVRDVVGTWLRVRPGASGWVAVAFAVATLAGCASPRPSAPVVHRVSPPPVAAVPATGTAAAPGVVPGSAASPAGAGVPGAPRGPGLPGAASPLAPSASAPASPSALVQPAPVRSGQVESRPLPALASSATLKTEPSGRKQPYSDALLARLQAAGTPLVAAPATPPEAAPGAAAAQPAAPPETKPGARPGQPDPAAGTFRWPSAGKLIEGFAEPRSMGVAIAGKIGDPVLAAADGKVIFSGPGPRSYGNLLIIKHEDELLSVYAHNRALLVKEGQQVKRGQRIAELGDSGTDRPKLHFEIRRQGRPIDPLPLLPPREP